MSNNKNNRMYASTDDFPIMDVSNVSDYQLERVSRINAGHKCKALVRMSAIVNHNMVAAAGMICQARLLDQVVILSQHNPAAAKDLRELSLANLLYIREQIYPIFDKEGY